MKTTKTDIRKAVREVRKEWTKQVNANPDEVNRWKVQGFKDGLKVVRDALTMEWDPKDIKSYLHKELKRCQTELHDANITGWIAGQGLYSGRADAIDKVLDKVMDYEVEREAKAYNGPNGWKLLIQEMDGREVRSVVYENVVGVRGNKVIDGGKVVDTLNTKEKVKSLWDEFIMQEFGTLNPTL